jgi:hypothetical protein
MEETLTRRWLAVLAIGTIVPVLAIGSAALGQTTARVSGAFEKLSLGNQKVAASLYRAQNDAGSAVRPFTLDQLAAKRQAGQGWGQIFRDLKAKGLVHEKSLGQVVTKYGPIMEPGATASLNGNGKVDR